VAARYNIVTAGREWVTVVASGVAAGRAGSRKSGRSRPTFGCIRTMRCEGRRFTPAGFALMFGYNRNALPEAEIPP
jgi:hypothetical protein